ncbi:MAG TPA: chloride channel protein [Steroidobacteraceae bacterium]|nr:chloride channel protein [Steroidobacteraceae bacterium]
MSTASAPTDGSTIPPTLLSPNAAVFWAAVLGIGVLTGLSTAALMGLLYLIQHRVWPGPHILDAAEAQGPMHHMVVLTAAGVLTGLGQVLLRRLSSGNSIDTTEAIANFAGRMPAVRTLGSALLSIFVVGMGASLGREGAPKQVGAVIANAFADRGGLSDEQRRLLVACGAGAGLSAAYGVPLGGALFAVEVLRGVLQLRLILPALLSSAVAAGIAWLALPNEPTYVLPRYSLSGAIVWWSVLAGPIIGVFSVAFIRLVAFGDRHKPTGALRLWLPVASLALLGALSIVFPQLLGNGKDVAELAFTAQVAPLLLLVLCLLKPLATVLCLGSGVPGGLFTPSLATGALFGGLLGVVASWWWPGIPTGLCALVGAGALLAATTHGPLSSILLMLELTGRDRSFILPMVLAVVGATVIARTLDERSIYDVRFSDRQMQTLQRARRPAAV